MSNHELLRRYLREDSQAAFATLVGRHVDLVYSAALRQVGQPHLAEEVAQSVFVDLARQARTLPADQPLSSWLYVVTRRTAIDVVRREARRRAGEESAAILATMRTESAGWTEIAALLDEAMAALDPNDRSAILLRYFENLSLHDVGESLGISEDTAQKRVSRALDRLRTFFGRRGVAVTAASLATNLSAHALQSAPAGLCPGLVSLALSKSSLAHVAMHAARPIVMTTAQKGLIATAVALVLVAGGVETWRIFQQRAELAALNERAAQAHSDLVALTRRRDEARRHEQLLQQQLAGRPTASPAIGDTGLAAEIRVRLARVKQLRQLIEQHPALSLPELRLLDDNDWLEIVKDRDFANEADLFAAVIDLRNEAKSRLADAMQQALHGYLLVNHGNLPAQISDLARMFPPGFDLTMLQRYELLHTGNVADLPHTPLPFKNATFSSRTMGTAPEEESPALIAEKNDSLLPDEGRLYVGRSAYVIMDEFDYEVAGRENGREKALAAYAQANHGAHPEEPAQLLPYFDPPLDAATQRRVVELSEAQKRREARNPFGK